MLSIENPPPDPHPCPADAAHEISHLKSSTITTTTDERRASSDKVALQEEEVDLFKSSLEDQNPSQKFSIRDYVFSARSKDIKTNWPFSQKNLQLCLKHGVKDLLPPFQPLDSVKYQFIERCTVETSPSEKENTSNLDGEPSGPSHEFVSASSDNTRCSQKLPVVCLNIQSSGSEGDKELPLTTFNQSHSETNSVPAHRTLCAALETNTQLEASSAKLQKTESTNQPPVKKCRLIVKLGGSTADPSSIEDTTTNCVAIPETMASNVCPVCKTFSSSSNTTLNAHIDQCLSVESTTKWTANSRVIKHRIKPRKIKLMVDIYATAPHCTLEELDRRNGTSWATNNNLPTQEIVECAEEEKQTLLNVNFKDKGDEGAVYIDASGKKLRILSKFNDSSSVPKLEADPRLQKPFRGRGSKLLSNYKKKHHAQKHHKYLKLAPQSKKSFSSKHPRRDSEVNGDQDRNFALEESCRKEERLTRPCKAQEQIKPNDSGTITKWARSKRTGLLKRRDPKEGLHHSGSYLRHELLVESDQSSLGDSYMERSCVQRPPNSYESPLSSPESGKRMENLSFKAPIYICNEQPPVRKRVGFTSFGSQISGNVEKLLEPLKRNVKQLRKDNTSVDGSSKDSARNGENYVNIPSLGKTSVEINASPVKNSSLDVFSNSSWNRLAFSSKATKFSSLRKHMSVNQASVPESKYKVKRKCSSSGKKSGVHCMAELDKDYVAFPSEVADRHDSKVKRAENHSGMEKITGEVPLGRHGVLKLRKKRRAFSISHEEESMALKSASEIPSHEVGNNKASTAGAGGNLAGSFDGMESDGNWIQTRRNNIVIGPSSEVEVGGNVMNLSKSLDPEFHKLASPGTLAAPFQSVVFNKSLCGTETSSCPTDSSLGDEHEMFCVDEVANGMISQNTIMGAEMDSKDGQGNYFTGVDPILIPGPPGSFLPSPRDMGSEDLQGNSSLTTSRVQSSEERHDLVDRDSSDSPISATSTISNSTIERSNLKSFEKFSGHHDTRDEIRSGFSSTCHNVVAENTELKVNTIVPEKIPTGFRNDMPCCCARKEGMSQGLSLNYQESQLLRRRTMASSVPVPTMGKQLSCDPNRRPNGLNSMPEVISQDNLPSSGSKKNSAVAPVSAGSVLKSPVYGDCDSASPSASNPVLRLMGKDLMVVNKDENASPQFKPSQSSSLNDQPTPLPQTPSGVSPGNSQNEDVRSFHHRMVNQHLISSQNQSSTGFEAVNPSNSFGSHAIISKITPQTPSHAPAAGMFLSNNGSGGFTASLEPQEYKVRCNYRPYTPSAYHMEKFATTSYTQRRNEGFTADTMKEIIIIDDTPEREADTVVPYSEGKRESSRVSPAGISFPMAANYNSRQYPPFYCYQPQDSSSFSRSHVQNATFQIPTPHSRESASPTKWNCTTDGLNVLPPSSLMASSSSSSSTDRLRSSLYYSPSFS